MTTSSQKGGVLTTGFQTGVTFPTFCRIQMIQNEKLVYIDIDYVWDWYWVGARQCARALM